MDPRFEALSGTQKMQYIFDILVPELIWLITVSQYLEDGREKLVAESGLSWEELEQDPLKKISAEKILEEAKKLASLDIHEVDMVDKVLSLRAQREKRSPSLPAESPITQSHSSSNSFPSERLRRNTSSSKLFSISCAKLPSDTPKIRQTSKSRKACTS
jgi:hypothetical protein